MYTIANASPGVIVVKRTFARTYETWLRDIDKHSSLFAPYPSEILTQKTFIISIPRGQFVLAIILKLSLKCSSVMVEV